VSVFGQLGDRRSPLVQAALTRKCIICKANPGEDCTNMPINHHALPGRIVHSARTVD
jgi:hypothetical protein